MSSKDHQTGGRGVGRGALRAQIGERTRMRGKSPRLYPDALVWCLKKAGRDRREHTLHFEPLRDQAAGANSDTNTHKRRKHNATI